MNLRVIPLLLLLVSMTSYAADNATTTLHWKGTVPTISPSKSVIITGPNGLLPYVDSAGLTLIDRGGAFTSDEIILELHHRKCKNGNSAGTCEEGQFVEGESDQAVGDLLTDTSWTMHSVMTVIGTTDTNWPFTWTEILMNGVAMEQSIPSIASSGTVIFRTKNRVTMGYALPAGQNIEVHSVISSSKSI